MKATRCRTRRSDPLASRAAVRTILAQLQTALGTASPKTEKDLVSLLRATGYAERHPIVVSVRGRKSRWSDYDKSRVRLLLTEMLARGTKRIGLRSFLEHYLSILDFPSDVAEALEAGTINLFEAEQLARLNATRLGLSEAKSKNRRQAFLKAHLQAAASGMRLKVKVDAALHLAQHPEAAQLNTFPAEVKAAAADLEAEINQSPALHEDWSEGLPPEHLFGEYLQLIGSLLREIRTAELSESEIERVAYFAEPLIQYLNTLYKHQNPPFSMETVQKAAHKFFI